MLIEARLGTDPARAGASGAAAAAAIVTLVGEGVLEPATTRVVLDWVQYRHSFRPAVLDRPVVDDQALHRREVAVDLRRVREEGVLEDIRDALGRPGPGAVLEEWSPLSASCLWRFNSLYWQELELWEKVAGRGYVQALPGGESGGTDRAATRATIVDLFSVWDGLAERHALPEQLTVLELGVGNGEQAKVFLDELRKLDAERGTGHYRRLQYLMGDYSAHVLERARHTVADHGERVSTLVLDAARPRTSLRFLDGKVFFVYISNVYDNLPTDELAVLDDVVYQVEVRAELGADTLRALSEDLAVSPSEVVPLAGRLVRLGPRLLSETVPGTFPDETVATAFWQRLWSGLRLAERYVPLGPLDCYEVADGTSGEVLRSLLDGYGDVRFHASNGAIGSFLDTVPLLHPLGSLVTHDLFVTDLAQYRAGFRGPGKYDGSVVNWVNGPLLQLLAGRRGFHVELSPFDGRSRSPIATARARARD